MCELRCLECGRKPDEITEYINIAIDDNISSDEVVLREEGTLNRATGKFWCTNCYIKLGQPLGKAK